MENHYISLENREKITISQVVDVDAFDEDTLWANLKDGGIVRKRVIKARKIQAQRFANHPGIYCNAQMDVSVISKKKTSS